MGDVRNYEGGKGAPKVGMPFHLQISVSEECNNQAFIKGVMLWVVTHLYYYQLINGGELYIYTPSYEQNGRLSECVHSVLVRHLGCGDCLYLSSRE